MSSISSLSSGTSSALTSASSSQSEAVKTLLASAQSTQASLLDSLTGSGSSDSSSSSDILDLSSAGQSAADQLFQLLESVAESQVQTSADKASASVQQKLSTALSQAGVDTSKEIDLQLGSNGDVTVSNDNSQAQQIESTINNNPDLKKAVTQYLQFMQAIAPTIENGSSTQTTSSSGLEQLVSSLKSDSQGTVTLALQGSSASTSYLDPSGNTVALAMS